MFARRPLRRLAGGLAPPLPISHVLQRLTARLPWEHRAFSAPAGKEPQPSQPHAHPPAAPEQQAHAVPSVPAFTLKAYLSKFVATQRAPAALPTRTIVTNGLAALLGFASVSLPVYFLDGIDSVYLIASFGASAALLFGAHDAPLAQPRNVIGGQSVSALMGVASMDLCTFYDVGIWFSAPLSVATAIVAMQALRCFHPPAAGTALVAVVGSPALHALGYWYVLAPCAIGSTVLVAGAAIVNNLIPGRQYPKYWL